MIGCSNIGTHKAEEISKFVIQNKYREYDQHARRRVIPELKKRLDFKVG